MRPANIILAGLLLSVPALAQYDWHETFEGGACAATWAGGCPTGAISANADLTGTHNLLNPGTTVGPSSLAASSLCYSFQYRKPNDPASNGNLQNLRNSATTQLVTLIHTSAGTLTATNNGGSNLTVGTISDDTTHLVEICAEKGTGANAKVKGRLDGGSFSETTNGTWTTDIHDLRLLAFAGDVDERRDEIKVCVGTYVGVSECDPPVSGWRPLLF